MRKLLIVVLVLFMFLVTVPSALPPTSAFDSPLPQPPAGSGNGSGFPVMGGSGAVGGGPPGWAHPPGSGN